MLSLYSRGLWRHHSSAKNDVLCDAYIRWGLWWEDIFEVPFIHIYAYLSREYFESAIKAARDSSWKEFICASKKDRHDCWSRSSLSDSQSEPNFSRSKFQVFQYLYFIIKFMIEYLKYIFRSLVWFHFWLFNIFIIKYLKYIYTERTVLLNEPKILAGYEAICIRKAILLNYQHNYVQRSNLLEY